MHPALKLSQQPRQGHKGEPPHLADLAPASLLRAGTKRRSKDGPTHHGEERTSVDHSIT
jgi:hypothetical protein